MVCIRADAGKNTGIGHVMRCLSLADAFRDLGEKVIFVSADENAREIVEPRGYECEILHTDHRDMAGETGRLKATQAYKQADLFIADSYYIADDYIEEISSEKKIAVFDDLCEKAYSADIVINYNLYAEENSYKELYGNPGKDVVFLTGPGYAPLRKEFSESAERRTVQNADKALIMTGGADSQHIGLRIAFEIVSRRKTGSINDQMRYDIVVGALSDDYSKLKELERESGGAIRILRGVSDMKGLMEESDMALSAAGSTLYELCACGVPTITYVLADNQINGEKAFTEKGIMLSAGDARNNESFGKKACDMLERLAGDRALRERMSANGKSLVDGKGAMRLAKKLMEITGREFQ